jgi:hypothetical protein
MAAHKEVTAILGEYTNANGEVKKRYMKIGAIIESKHGPMLKLEVIPLEWNGYAYINEPYDKSNPRSNKQSEQSQRSGMDSMHDDEIPF